MAGEGQHEGKRGFYDVVGGGVFISINVADVAESGKKLKLISC